MEEGAIGFEFESTWSPPLGVHLDLSWNPENKFLGVTNQEDPQKAGALHYEGLGVGLRSFSCVAGLDFSVRHISGTCLASLRKGQ